MSIFNADLPNVATPSQQPNGNITVTGSSSTEECVQILGPQYQSKKRTVCIQSGHIQIVNIEWDVASVHVGDEKLIEVALDKIGGAKKLVVTANSVVVNDEEKRTRPPLSYTNFHVFGTQSQEIDYDVVIRNYALPIEQPIQPVQPMVPISKDVEIHNQKTLSGSTNYACERNNCKLK